MRFAPQTTAQPEENKISCKSAFVNGVPVPLPAAVTGAVVDAVEFDVADVAVDSWREDEDELTAAKEDAAEEDAAAGSDGRRRE
jgi:hypothetical protein